MIMDEQKIREILNDLYSLEPALKSREAEVRQIINQLLTLKPDAVFDAEFKNKLKQELAINAENLLHPKTNFLKNLTNNFMEQMNAKALVGAGLVVVLLVAGSFYAGKQQGGPMVQNGRDNTQGGQESILTAPLGSEEQVKAIARVKQFESEEEFKNYLTMAGTYGGYGMGGGRGMGGDVALSMPTKSEQSLASPAPYGQESTQDRSSQTNVQVVGIDEPDIVKTDGKNLFISSPNRYGIMYDKVMVMPESGIMPPWQIEQSTQIISALPPEAIKKLGKIDKQGEMLLQGDILVIFNYDYVYGFNIKDKANPKEVWKIKYENNSYLNTARMYDGRLYLVTSSYPNYENPCPIIPLSKDSNNITVPCREIYHPIVPASDITVYSAIKINPQNGEVQDKLSFVGSSGQAIVYMSPNALYLSYTYMEDQVKIMTSFIKNEGKGIFSDSVVAKIDKLNTYELSSTARMVEMQQILERYLSTLGGDERVKFSNDLQNKISDYLKAHKRELQFTGIVKIPLNSFKIEASGNVPGSPLNQFAMDEYKGNLRIATTIGQNGFWFIWGWGGGSTDESANDVYVLDSGLKQIGKVTDLGKGERIYSARFIDDKGYLVTFRQIDPFYVLDLSNASNPRAVGELKIPGFSSYLHPLAENRILGVGQEGGRVKLSLFDVSNPADPREISKYSLDEYWTEAANNHHAFLQDSRHQVFFLPGGNSGYVFSYAGDKLNLEKAISDVQAQRALYINDTMYIVGYDQIVVLDEKTWSRIGELGL